MAFPLQFLLLLLSLLISCFSGGNSVKFFFRNNCSIPVWPGVLTGSGNQPSSTGFELRVGWTATVTVSPPWSGRFWPRTLCFQNILGRFACATGDCGTGKVSCNGAGGIPPATLLEFTVAPNISGQDFYDISLVDGFNLPVSVTPVGRSRSSGCRAAHCAGNVNAVCPLELTVHGPPGKVIACKSACLAFNKPEYCCSGAHDRPETCPPTDYSKIFKSQCPEAYSYAYDDKTSTFTCSGGANYDITFCP